MRKILGFLAALLFAAPAWATCSAVPFIFAPGTTALSGQVNANLAALVACINSLSGSQITSGTIQNARLDLTTLLTALSGLPHKANNAALTATASTAYTTVVRDGFATPGDGGAATYTSSNVACTLNAGAGDNGSQVQSADGKCWLASFDASGADFRVWGARPGFNVDTAIAAAVAWACASHYPLLIHYDPARYEITATVNIGDGSVSAVSTCNNVTIRGDSPMQEYTSGLGPLFNWAGAAGGTAFSVNGPIASPTIENLAVDCLNLCATGWEINNPIDGYFSRLGVRSYAAAANKAAFIITSVPGNSLLSGNEGTTYSLLGAWAPGTGASGMIVGDSACLVSCFNGGAVIANKFDNMSLEHDCLSAGTWGIKLQFATQLTFDHTRIVGGDGQVCPGPAIANSIVVVSPTGTSGVNFPTDITFLHPLFQMPVLDPGAGWLPISGGINFQSYSTAFTTAPASVTPGAFWGTTSAGQYFGSTRIAFTPILLGSSTAGAPTYAATPIGSIDTTNSIYRVRFNISASALVGSVGNLQVGLPTSAVNRANDNGMCFISLHSGLAFTAGYTSLSGYVAPGTNAVNIMQNGSGVTFAALPSAAAAAGATLFGWCEYPGQ